MLIPLAYPIIKRIPFLHAHITKHILLKSILTMYIFVGFIGPLLAIVHTGHKFSSWLGIALTAAMLLMVVSGYLVGYLHSYVGKEIKDKNILLLTARGDLDNAWGVAEKSQTVKAFRPSDNILKIAASVADLEYAIKTHEIFKRWFARALRLHIIVSVAFYVLLGLHIWSGIHFGLRWLK